MTHYRNKIRGHHLAPGIWSSPNRRYILEDVPNRIKAWNYDKQITRGLWCYLYQPVNANTPGVVPCTCVKNTNDDADKSCMTCAGTKFAPAYLKTFHQTQFWCSSESQNFLTLTNVTVDTTKKVNRLAISPGFTTATIVTQDKLYSNVGTPTSAALLQDYDVNVNAYLRAPGSTFTVEFSTDTGTTWHTLSLTETPTGSGLGYTGTIAASLLPSSSGTVRLRITLTRSSVNDQTPMFEIARIRRKLVENSNPEIMRVRPDFTHGAILVLRPWIQQVHSLEAGRGLLVDNVSDRTWFLPLDLFDMSLTPDTPACRIDDTQNIPHPFYHYTTGVASDQRMVCTKVDWNVNFGVFTQQWVDDRRAQDHEFYNKVW